MSQTISDSPHPTIDSDVWPEIELPPTADQLPYDDGEPMESPWHSDNARLLRAGYIAARGGRREDYYVGANMFVYYSMQQVRNKDYKGPDVYIVKNVDGTKPRLSWVAWEEDGRYPDVIFELLSQSTQQQDLGEKKRIYEQIFRTPEYFCIAPEAEYMLGWRLKNGKYEPIEPDERGWLWSQELALWLGIWTGKVLDEEHTWARFYTAAGSLVLLPEEAEKQRADEEKQRADELAARLSALEAELARLKSQSQEP